MFECEHCTRSFKTIHARSGHVWLCKNNPDRRDHPRGALGKTSWNRDKTKEDDERLAKAGQKLSSKYKSGEVSLSGACDPKFAGTERHREMSSKGGGYKPGAGRSKKFWVKDSYGVETCLQSSYEFALSEKLEALQIKWIRPKPLKYGKRNYFPDFYLVDYDVYIDTKNDYLRKLDAEKIASVIEENGVNLRVLSKTDIEEYAGESEKRGAQPITVL